MPTYNAAAVSDATIAFQKPITLQQGRALRDNALAMFEGAPGAPRVWLRALENLNPGTFIRSRNDEEFTTSDATASGRLNFAFAQSGVIRAAWEYKKNAVNPSIMNVLRTRTGVTTNIGPLSTTSAVYVSVTIDFSVMAGDAVLLVFSNNSNGSVKNVRFQTNGEDLWPGVSANVEGNRVAL